MILTESRKDWAIFRLNNGKKWWATRYNPSMKSPDQYRSDVKYSSPEVLKFDSDTAIRIIQKTIGTHEKYGIVNAKGLQKVFDWRVKYPDKYDDVDKLIKKEIMKPIKLKDLLNEESSNLVQEKTKTYRTWKIAHDAPKKDADVIRYWKALPKEDQELFDNVSDFLMAVSAVQKGKFGKTGWK